MVPNYTNIEMFLRLHDRISRHVLKTFFRTYTGIQAKRVKYWAVHHSVQKRASAHQATDVSVFSGCNIFGARQVTSTVLTDLKKNCHTCRDDSTAPNFLSRTVVCTDFPTYTPPPPTQDQQDKLFFKLGNRISNNVLATAYYQQRVLKTSP